MTKKKRKKKPQYENIMSVAASATQGGHKKKTEASAPKYDGLP